MKYTRITLRIPVDVHQWLVDRAAITSKSMNAEIIERLNRTIEEDKKLDKELISLIESMPEEMLEPVLAYAKTLAGSQEAQKTAK